MRPKNNWREKNLWTQGGQWNLNKISPPKINALKHIQNAEDSKNESWKQRKITHYRGIAASMARISHQIPNTFCSAKIKNKTKHKKRNQPRILYLAKLYFRSKAE